jgi:succinate dehydrogenase/fumarate reductase cytochrome b subunit
MKRLQGLKPFLYVHTHVMNAMFFFSNSQQGQKEAFSFYIDIHYECNGFFSNSQEGQKEAFSFYINIHYEFIISVYKMRRLLSDIAKLLEKKYYYEKKV